MTASLCFVNACIEIMLSGILPYQQIFLRNKGFSHGMTGVIISLGQFIAVISPLAISNYADKSGNARNIITITSIAGIIGLSLAAFSGSSMIVIAGMMITSIICGVVNPLFDGYVNRAVKSTSEYGKIRASGSGGYVILLLISSAIGFPNQSDNFQILVSMTAKTILMIVAVLLFVRKEPALCVSSDTSETKQNVFSSLGVRFYLFFAVYSVTRLAQSIPEKLLSSYMTEVMGLGTSFTAYIALGAFPEIFVMIYGAKYINGKTDRCIKMLIVSSVALVLRLIIYRLHPSVPVFALTQLLHGFTYAAAHIAGTCYIAANVKKEHYTLGISIMSSAATAIPEMMGALSGGFIIEKLGYDSLFSIFSLFPAVAALFLIFFGKHFFCGQQQS